MTDDINHAARAHSELAASATERWWECSRSVAASRSQPDSTSSYAEIGTAAHELANICLESGQDAIEYVGRTVHGMEMTDEFAEPVQVYLDECRRYVADGWSYWIEQRVSLEALNPPSPMFGTSDFSAFHAESGLLVIVDYKHGQGVGKEAAGNKQLLYYALGVYLTLLHGCAVKRVRMTIVQPRLFGSRPIKTDEIDFADLMAWSVDLMERARATLDPAAQFNPGPWCRFCKAAPCPGQAKASMALAEIEFDDYVTKPAHLPELPNVEALTPEQLGLILNGSAMLEGFLGAVEKRARFFIEQGVEVPGWMLSPTESRQKWVEVDQAALVQVLTLLSGVEDAREFVTMSVKSPAQVRGVLKAHIRSAEGVTAKEAEAKARSVLQPLIQDSSGGTKLVPKSELLPAASVRGDEFDQYLLDTVSS